MSSPTCLLGIDVGTESCKAIVFNERGESLARSYREHPTLIPHASWAEQDPYLWWENVVEVVSDVVKAVRSSSRRIACVTVTGQSPVLVAVDKFGSPLMNAIVWMDRRAVDQSRTVARLAGLAEDPSMILPKILWIKEKQPHVYQKTYKFLQATDFIGYKITGTFATDWFSAFTCHFDLESRRWPEEILEHLDIPLERFPEVFRPTEILGAITQEASHKTGLEKGVPVVAGGIDAYMAVIGANALREGSACEITGSSTCLMVPSRRKIADRKGRIASAIFPLLPHLFITWAVMSSTGASLRWFRDRFGHSEESFEDLDREAEKVSAGADGLIFLPYMMGERSPIWSPSARGVLAGLSLHHTRNHVIRAILEGCAFGIRHNMEIIEESGGRIDEIRSCGGAARSTVFGQIKADVTGKPIVIPRETEAPALGAAISGAVAVGVHKDIKEAAENMVQVKYRIDPRKVLSNRYDLAFRMYKDVYSHLKEYFNRYYSPSNDSLPARDEPKWRP